MFLNRHLYLAHPATVIGSAASASTWLHEEIHGSPQPWRVLSLHSYACNLENRAGAIAALVSPRYGNGPFHVVAPAALFPTLTQGEKVYLGDGLIRLSSGILDARSARCWSPCLPQATFTPLATDLYFALIENRSFLTSKNSGSQFNRSIMPRSVWLHEYEDSTLISSPSQNMTMLTQRATEALAALEAGWHTRDLHLIAEGAHHLAGLGPGLTPAGDDWMVGWLAGLFLFGEQYGMGAVVRQVARTVADAATPRTTRLSAAWLRHAARGEFAEPWHQMAMGLNSGDIDAAAQAVQRILNTGATSGQDGMAGFLNAVRLFKAWRERS
jgi:hypothetical protein